MNEPNTVSLTGDGFRCADRPWEPPGSWVGAVALASGDRRAELLTVAARARDTELAVVSIAPVGPDGESLLSSLTALPQPQRPRGLLLGESMQEVVAARCTSLTGAAAGLGLADAVRVDEDGGWHGHHLVAGAVEAFLAQIWPESAGPMTRATVLGDGPLAMVAALIAARRGAPAVTVIVATPSAREDLTARMSTAVDWPPNAVWQVSDRLEADVPPGGVWIRATEVSVPDGIWLPDTAGDDPCVLVDLAGVTPQPPLGFVHPVATGVQVMAAGLATAWYLGPPIPWDALTAGGI